MRYDRASKIIAGVMAVGITSAIALACGDSSDRAAPSAASGKTPAVERNEPPSAPPAQEAPKETLPMSAEELAARGRGVFMSNCIACHNQNPGEAGAVGPAIAGSSLELLVAKVMHNEYPPGYTPKRDSRAMIPLPFLEKELPAIHAYLTAAK